MKEEELIKYTFIFLGLIFLATSMFGVGMLVGQFGTAPLRGILFALTPTTIFWIGRFSYKYQKQNPL